MRPVASGHGANSSPPPPLPTCVVSPKYFLNFFFKLGVSKEGVPNHGTNLGFTSANLMGGFTKGVPNSWHVPRFLPP